MRLLLTRPREESEALETLLADRDIETVIEPLMEIHPIAGPPLDLRDSQAVLATSANGIRAFTARNAERHLPVYAVGDATAREAVSSGFDDVHSATGNVDALANLVSGSLQPAAGTLLHPAGTRVAGDLAGRLQAGGFVYRREVLYQAQAASNFSDPVREMIAARRLEGVLLFSPRTGATFARLMAAAKLTDQADTMTAYCLSQAVAEAVATLPMQRVGVAVRPEQSALLDLLAENRK